MTYDSNTDTWHYNAALTMSRVTHRDLTRDIFKFFKKIKKKFKNLKKIKNKKKTKKPQIDTWHID